MKILKHGDLKPRKFTCPKCGCELVANMMEYTRIHVEDGYCICCPECMHYIIASTDEALLYKEDPNKTLDAKLTKIIDKLDNYVRENISIYDHDIYVNLRDMIYELADWQEEYKNESKTDN